MLRAFLKSFAVICLIFGGSVGIWIYQDKFAATQQIAKLQQEKVALQKVVSRLGEEKRVAEILVRDQQTDESGKLTTELLFVEYDKSGQSLAPKVFTIEGKFAHVDAMVIKFDQHFVAEDDEFRGHSIALFTRIFGDYQAPATAPTIDSPGGVPEIYRNSDPRIANFEQDLWAKFWQLTDDAKLRKDKGVRVAMGQAAWGMFEPGKLYTLTLESNGGLNLTSEPLKGIYKEAMKLK